MFDNLTTGKVIPETVKKQEEPAHGRDGQEVSELISFITEARSSKEGFSLISPIKVAMSKRLKTYLFSKN